jgi:hypothetical protein
MKIFIMREHNFSTDVPTFTIFLHTKMLTWHAVNLHVSLTRSANPSHCSSVRPAVKKKKDYNMSLHKTLILLMLVQHRRHHLQPARAAAAILLRTPPSTLCYSAPSACNDKLTARQKFRTGAADTLSLLKQTHTLSHFPLPADRTVFGESEFVVHT